MSLDAAGKAVAAREPQDARQAALDITQAGLDLRMRHEPVAKVDLGRLSLWARQLLVDTAAREAGNVSGSVTTIQRVWDRVRHTVDASAASRVDALILQARKDAANAAPALITTLQSL